MTKKILVTGGTVFVSKFVATYFKNHDYDVYVLNRGNRKQIEGVKLNAINVPSINIAINTLMITL